MALGFFRRHQKMVMIIMAVLMVSFLVTYQGVQALMDAFRTSATIGTSKYGKLTSNEYQRAMTDLGTLGEVPQLANSVYEIKYLGQVPRTPAGLEYSIVTGGELQRSPTEQAVTAFALLMQEAKARGIVVTDQDVENYKVQDLGLTGDRYKLLLERIREKRYTEKDFNQAVRDLLLVYKSAETAAVDTPPSEAALRQQYQLYFEKIKLAMTHLPAKDFINNVTTQPSDQQIVDQFQKYRNQLPGENTSDYGFGYKTPDKAKVAYLFINQEVVIQAGEPTDQQVRDYKRDHKNEIVAIPMPASSPAASSPASEPAAETQKVALGTLDFATAKPIVSEKLARSYASDMTDKLLTRIEELSVSLGASQDTYGNIVTHMIQPAGDKLAMPIHKSIENLTLQQAMQSLSAEAGLANICLPWGKHGNVTIDPKLRVTVKASPDLTLEQALNQIVSQIGSFKIDRWVMCDRVDNVLFPLPPAGLSTADCFPVSAGASELMDVQGFAADPLLGRCSTTQDSTKGQPLIQKVFTAAPFGTKEGQTQMNVGDSGPIMYVAGEEIGRLVWKLVDAKPAAAPSETELLTNSKLRQQVTEDIKIVAAMKLAADKAAQIAKAADTEGLEKAAAAESLKVVQTDFFNRFIPKDPSGQYNVKPELRGIVMQESIPYFIKQAFTLVPENVEPTDGNYPPSKALAIDLPGAREVVVVQRIGYQPVVQSDFQGITHNPLAMDKNQLIQKLREETHVKTVARWCLPQNVQERLNYHRGKE